MRDVIGRRVDRLGDEAREVLTLAAVIGRSFELELLARLAETTESELLDRLEAAVTASLLDESTERVGRFRFVHALINQTLYDGLGATRRSSMHHRVALALEELYGTIRTSTSPSWHCTGGWRRPTARRRRTIRRARGGGRSTASRRAEAAKLFADALELLGPVEDAERCRALIGLGEAQQLIGDPAYRKTLLHAARIASALGDADLAAAAALANTRGFTSLIGDLDDERVDAIERARRARRPLRRGPARPAARAAVAGAALRARPRPGGKRSRRRRSRSHVTSAIRESGHACCSTRSTACGAPTWSP